MPARRRPRRIALPPLHELPEAPPPEPEQPTPLQTFVHHVGDRDGYPVAVVIRHWEPGDAVRCTRCEECRVWRVRDPRGRYDGEWYDGDTRPVYVCQVNVRPDRLHHTLFG